MAPLGAWTDCDREPCEAALLDSYLLKEDHVGMGFTELQPARQAELCPVVVWVLTAVAC